MPPHDLPIHPGLPTEAWLQSAQGERVALTGNCSFGRSEENNIVLTVPKASRRHAAIHRDRAEGYLLLDLNSRNGTFLNGHRVSQPTALTDGDRITVADVVFTFRQLASPSGARPGRGVPGSETLMVLDEKPTWLLMADMQGFTEMARKLSPKELIATSGEWHARCREAVEREDGHVGKVMGDGMLAYWPAAEGAEVRVVAVLRALRELQLQLPAPFRVVIHRGLVAFGGAMRLGEEGMVGAAVNFIFHLEKVAARLGEPICVSESAAGVLRAHLAMEPIGGDHAIKGFSGPQAIHRPVWENAAPAEN